MEPFDLVVIGAGSAGLAAATFAARLGARVALVERDRIGGDCTWTGCVPSKALLHAAALAHQMRHADRFGLPAAALEVDLARVMAAVRAASERVYRFETPDALRAQGIAVFSGAARFRDPHRVAVDGRTLRARRFLICTGARPAIPPLPGLAEVPYLTNETVFQLGCLPRRLLVLGGGPQGVEFAQAFQRLGAAVTLIEREPRLLGFAEPEASRALARVLMAEGVRLRTGSRVQRAEGWADGVRVVLDTEAVAGDRLLVAAGRHPNLDGLDLERAGVAFSGRGIAVDDALRTSRRHIYAAGDVTGSFEFTHYAAWQGFVAARNALMPRASRGTRPTVPWAVFTDPEVGQVGWGEAAARRHRWDVRVARWPVARIDRAQAADAPDGFIKLTVRADGTLLGATVVAAAAGEIVNHLALALEHGLRVAELARTIHAYPTYGFGVQQLSAEATFADLTRGWRGRLLKALARSPFGR
jgi:pyruvate/2-oxoglutarate dehydrogenase complex dihydrolipoamide dehydrogenase (E3) component